MPRAFCFLAFALSCAAQRSAHLDPLIDHWRWMQYWEGATELGARYKPGTEVHLLLFWPKDPAYSSAAGFCSSEVRMCQFYPNLAGPFGHSEMEMFPKEEDRQAFSRFVEEVLGQTPTPAGRKPKDADYVTETTTLALPQLTPPPGVAERKMAPRERIELLAEQFACRLDRPQCKNHVLIPFFGEADQLVPVYSECAMDCKAEDAPAITFFRWDKGVWWKSFPTSTKVPDDVKRIRGKIEEALMAEVGR